MMDELYYALKYLVMFFFVSFYLFLLYLTKPLPVSLGPHQ